MSKQQVLNRKQQKDLEKLIVNKYSSLSKPVQVFILIGVVLTLVVGSFWYSNGGEEKIAQLLGAGTAMTDVTGDYAPTTWEEKTAPNYYRVDGAAIKNFDISVGEIRYGELDLLGRATYAVGYLTKDMYEEELLEEREQNLPKPVGYKNYYVGNNPTYNTTIIGDGIHYWNNYVYTGAFYNRSHLLADSIGGAAIQENLVTGTRCQNTGTNNANNSGYGGMAYTEDIARKYLKKHNKGLLYYSVIPVYSGNELIPRSVFVDMVSDDGIVNLHVEVYNTAKGYNIDYVTGEVYSLQSQ